jgi:hypothetical protein
MTVKSPQDLSEFLRKNHLKIIPVTSIFDAFEKYPNKTSAVIQEAAQFRDTLYETLQSAENDPERKKIGCTPFQREEPPIGSRILDGYILSRLFQIDFILIRHAADGNYVFQEFDKILCDEKYNLSARDGRNLRMYVFYNGYEFTNLLVPDEANEPEELDPVDQLCQDKDECIVVARDKWPSQAMNIVTFEDAHVFLKFHYFLALEFRKFQDQEVRI